jgi:hypothetical protein
MSAIVHHAERGGLDATLGYGEFGAPTSSGQSHFASSAIAARSGLRPARRVPVVWPHDLEPAQRRGLVS